MRHLNSDSPSTEAKNNNNDVGEELNENEDEQGNEAARKNITIKVLITKMGRLATFEALRETKETIKVYIT